MNEKDLIELWNDKRRQIISAQMPSVIALAVITVMAMLGYFDSEYNYGISFAALFLVSVGALSILNQLAVIREGQMIIKDLQAVDNPSALATKIAASGSYLVYTRALMIAFSLALLLVLVLLIL
ncbi:hypothetical protein OA174_00150 [Actinomycetota bacterium]|nr:hypothetical protein [Actinomycetota bacterium]